MRDTDHFSAAAAGYARSRPDYPPALADWLAAVAPGRTLAWEAGCGSGQLTLPLAERFARVRATDLSATQLAEAPRRDRIDYAVAWAEASGLADACADLAVAAQAAHWFDLPAYYAEVRRVVRPGGAVVLIAYGVIEAEDAPWSAALGRFYGDTLAGCWPPERAHVEAGYRDLPFPFPELAAPALAIERDWALADLLGYVDTWSAVRALEKRGRRADFDAFAAELGAAWGPPETRRRVRWPLAIRAGRV